MSTGPDPTPARDALSSGRSFPPQTGPVSCRQPTHRCRAAWPSLAWLSRGAALSVVLLLLAGCGTAALPAPDPFTPTPSAAALPVRPTAVPPSATPRPSATPTPSPTAAPRPSTTGAANSPPAATETPRIVAEYVTMNTDDGVELFGRLYQGREPAIILAHMGVAGSNNQDWQRLARVLAGRGFAVLAFDFRGYGRSAGIAEQAMLIHDMHAAAEFLRSRGLDRIACAGASMGGTACLRLAVESDLVAVAELASPMTVGYPTSITSEELAALTIPKLFVCADHDRFEGLAAVTQQMYRLSAEPKTIQLYPGTAHGTELFNTPYGGDLIQLMLDFFEGLRR